MSRLRLLATTGAALALSACVGDDQTLVSVPTPINGVNATTGVSYFDRYVSLGNSITAGFQSSGLVDSLQERSYAVLLAQRGGTTDFRTPGVSRPGCPVPFVTPLGAGVTLPEQNCTLTLTGSQPSLSRNLAVPGARLRDLLSVPSPLTNAGRLNLLLVGPRSQVRAMKESQPTFVSVWIGNNDALEATVGGVLGPLSAGADSSLTPLATFQAQLAMLVDSIKSAAPRGVLLVGVVDAIQAVPLIQPGAFFFLARGADGRFQGKPVNDNCSPVNALGQPNPLAQNMVSFQAFGTTGPAAAVTEINCAGTAAGGLFVLDANERATITARVAAYNQAIQTAATNNGWAYINPNDVLNEFRNQATNGRTNRARKCQGLATATTPAAFQTAVLNTCPVTGTTAAPNFFGSLFSFDGVHPSTEAHRIIAGRFAARINATYGTTLPETIT